MGGSYSRDNDMDVHTKAEMAIRNGKPVIEFLIVSLPINARIRSLRQARKERNGNGKTVDSVQIVQVSPGQEGSSERKPRGVIPSLLFTIG
jgi:hypothetical protein